MIAKGGTDDGDSIDHRSVDWKSVDRAVYAVRQRFAYEYPGPIANLEQRFVVVPPSMYGDQRLCSYQISADLPGAHQTESIDEFGNRVVSFSIPSVEQRATFRISLEVERGGRATPPLVSTRAVGQALQTTRLTEADAALRAEAWNLTARLVGDAEAKAQTIAEWVYETMSYERGVTDVQTTAAEAFKLRAGVCQDYAHLMLALCHLQGIPARYVSGHLLGEGGTHAWVEVLSRSPGPESGFRALAFDPTHGRKGDLSYITVATGRDYADVAPTSGSFIAPYGGLLSATKRASVTSIERRVEDEEAESCGAA